MDEVVRARKSKPTTIVKKKKVIMKKMTGMKTTTMDILTPMMTMKVLRSYRTM